MDNLHKIELRNNLIKIKFELMSTLRQLDTQIDNLTKKIEVECKHNWIIDSAVFDHQSHYVCSICNLGI